MTPKFYPLLQRCIEDGIALGYARAHKYGDPPGDETIKGAIYDAVMSEIHEWFDFPEAPSENGS